MKKRETNMPTGRQIERHMDHIYHIQKGDIINGENKAKVEKRLATNIIKF